MQLDVFVKMIRSQFILCGGMQKSSHHRGNRGDATPYCECLKSKRTPVHSLHREQMKSCGCGEETEVFEWKWKQPELTGSSMAVISTDNRQVLFHPLYSSGTAVIRGDMPLQHDHHHYWEVKMLTETYGTDIMIGIGTDKVNTAESEYRFASLLGDDAESYGLSYRGRVRHKAAETGHCAGFCRGTVVGVRLDMWRGTLEFYLNRKPQGIAFYNLRRHQTLYPMLCSTAAQSCMLLTYAASWQASLLVSAAKTLAASVSQGGRSRLPPGLRNMLGSHFWLTLPTEGQTWDDAEQAASKLEPPLVAKGKVRVHAIYLEQ